MGATAKPHYHGHRQRLRRRFLEGGPDALADYELLELLLFAAVTRGDVKPLAKTLINEFGGFAEVISAPAARLAEVKGIGESTIVALKTAQAAALRLLRENAKSGPVLASWDKVLDYCRASMARLDSEQFRILFLDAKNRVMADEVQQQGTVNHAPVYPREVIKRALELGASAVIMVHNHPSGDPKPSRADIEITREVRDAARHVGIALHDHLIIGRDGFVSLKSEGVV